MFLTCCLWCVGSLTTQLILSAQAVQVPSQPARLAQPVESNGSSEFDEHSLGGGEYTGLEWGPVFDDYLSSRDDLIVGDTEAARHNLCKNGRLVPEFYVIGLQKAGTTSLAAMFMLSPSVINHNVRDELKNPGEASTDKELHLFDSQAKFEKNAFKFEAFPWCPLDARVIATDFTPNYFGTYRYSAPSMAGFYGNLGSRLKFVVILREPVSRMFSGYWQTRQASYSGAKGALEKQVSFQQYVNAILSDHQSSPTKVIDSQYDCFEWSKYVPSLRTWIGSFMAEQFIIAGMQHAIGSKEMWLHPYLWTNMGLQVPAHPPEVVAEVNTSPHPSLEDSITKESLASLTGLLTGWSSPAALAHLFSEYKKVNLYRCFSCDSEDKISAWISSTW